MTHYFVPSGRRPPKLEPQDAVKRQYPLPAEVLSGKVLGKNASDIEERSARAIAKLGDPFYFRIRLTPVAGRGDHGKPQIVYELTEKFLNVAGELELDFLVMWHGIKMFPILVDGEISHYKTPAQQVTDEAKTDAINIALLPYGAFPAVRVPFDKLETQASADFFYRSLLA